MKSVMVTFDGVGNARVSDPEWVECVSDAVRKFAASVTAAEPELLGGVDMWSLK